MRISQHNAGVLSARRGFSALELIVVVAIIGILIALLLPGIQQAREAARRSQCSNNLKQLAIAYHNYHETYRVFPPGSIALPGDSQQRFMGHLSMLLPYLEHVSLYDSINFKLGPRHAANRTVYGTTVRTFLCPSDLDRANLKESAGTNYFGIAGTGPGVVPPAAGNKSPAPNGLIFHLSSVKFNQIHDGLSRTLLNQESTMGKAGPAFSFRGYVALDKDLPVEQDNQAGASEWKQEKNIRYDRGAHWMDGLFLQSLSVTSLTPNSTIADLTYRGLAGGRAGPRSAHPGGTNVGMADGSVNFMSNSVDSKFFQSLGSRSGFEKFTE